MTDSLRRFFASRAAPGVLLAIAAVLGMVACNSPLAALYDGLLRHRLGLGLGMLRLEKPLLLWINDGLMAVFFLFIGLELKKEMIVGELREPARMLLPGSAAIGGMVAPALLYLAINRGDPPAMMGWAIPTATDIAFSLGVLTLVPRRLPASLELLLLTLAVVDDLLAIVVIALFYTAALSLPHLGLALACIGALALLQRRNVQSLAPYLVVGALFWVFVLKSGVHATLAGVITAMFVPFGGGKGGHSPLERLEHWLRPWVSFAILPIFGFANAGVSLAGLHASDAASPVPLGIALGLLAGKPVGVLAAVRAVTASGLARLPEGCRWGHICGVGFLCGIGFTMSLFIASLAFEGGSAHAPGTDRLGILLGSLASAAVGFFVLMRAERAKPANEVY